MEIIWSLLVEVFAQQNYVLTFALESFRMHIENWGESEYFMMPGHIVVIDFLGCPEERKSKKILMGKKYWILNFIWHHSDEWNYYHINIWFFVHFFDAGKCVNTEKLIIVCWHIRVGIGYDAMEKQTHSWVNKICVSICWYYSEA